MSSGPRPGPGSRHVIFPQLSAGRSAGLSAGLSACRHVSSELSQQGSVCGSFQLSHSSGWCWITLGPAHRLHFTHNSLLLLGCQLQGLLVL
ncbi:hypothetical protein NQZ68_039167 [Dissostichus eleginoides]|nr:hypothetical protein NQZ68_039167 [Dissostichus eleginoides]